MTDREARSDPTALVCSLCKQGGFRSIGFGEEWDHNLITCAQITVEALREQVGELKADFKQMSEQYGAANKFMAEFMEERDAAEALNKDMAEASMKLLDILQLGTLEAAAKYGPDFDLQRGVIDAAGTVRAVLKKVRP